MSTSRQIVPVDPEIQAVYDQVNKQQRRQEEPETFDAEVIEADAEPAEDDFQAFARIAKSHEAKQANAPKAPMGSFDHFQQGVETTLRIGWDWLTR